MDPILKRKILRSIIMHFLIIYFSLLKMYDAALNDLPFFRFLLNPNKNNFDVPVKVVSESFHFVPVLSYQSRVMM